VAAQLVASRVVPSLAQLSVMICSPVICNGLRNFTSAVPMRLSSSLLRIPCYNVDIQYLLLVCWVYSFT
jgi:hypothetical protein